MEKKDELYELIYEYYESRIRFGAYRYGEQLMSMPQICASFRLARNTVQAALDKLEKNGYIKTEERKVARVVYQGTEEMYRKSIAGYFVPRKEGILDIHYHGGLMFLPMWEIGVSALELELNRDGTEKQKKGEKEVVLAATKLYFDVLSTFHNGLALSLYWQILRYLNYLYPRRDEEMADLRIERQLSVNRLNDMKQGFDEYLVDTLRKVLQFIDSAKVTYHLEDADPIPFTWTLYRRRPQVRYTLASTIIREILWERYPAGSYLPSLPKMAEQYQVSLSTVRRTLDVLHSLGVTKTYMGIGTEVCLEPIDDDILNNSEIRENLRLHGEGMQILALTVRGVTLYTLQAVSGEKRQELLESIRKLQGKNNGILCIDVLLSFIADECPSAFVRECYGKLRELAAWGYIFSAVLMSTGQLNPDVAEFVSHMEKDLRNDDLEAFAGRWQSLIENRMAIFNSKFPLWNSQWE